MSIRWFCLAYLGTISHFFWNVMAFYLMMFPVDEPGLDRMGTARLAFVIFKQFCTWALYSNHLDHCQRYLNMNQNERGPTARPSTIQALIPCMVITMSKYSAALDWLWAQDLYLLDLGQDQKLSQPFQTQSRYISNYSSSYHISESICIRVGPWSSALKR